MELNFSEAIDGLIDVNVISQIKSCEHVVIFGAGESGTWVQNVLEKNGIYAVCFCDNYSAKWGEVKNGLPIYSFPKAYELYHNMGICIASMWYEEIFEQILSYDSSLRDRVWNLLTSMNWETMNKTYMSKEKDFILTNLDKFECIYNQFADELSKKTLEGLLNYRLTRRLKYIEEIKSDDDIYLDSSVLSTEQLKKIKQKSIIDGGAFDGDTIEYFIKKLKDNHLHIHAYEAGKSNCMKMRNKISDLKGMNIVIHQVALWDKSGQKLKFNQNGLSGNISESNLSEIVYTEKIDDLTEKVGYIKLDVEGAEREVLRGALQTIEKERPILAICAYHLQDDLIELVNLIQAMPVKYDIYLRHYMLSAGDTIIYAVPQSEEKYAE